MNQDVYQHFLARLITLYGLPNTDNAQQFLEEYSKALAGTRVAILSAGADYLIKCHSFSKWPTVAECIQACEIVASSMAQPVYDVAPPYVEPSSGEKARVTALCKSFVADMKAKAALMRGNSAKVFSGTGRDAFARRGWNVRTLAEELAQDRALSLEEEVL